jgi:hypothetical protein
MGARGVGWWARGRGRAGGTGAEAALARRRHWRGGGTGADNPSPGHAAADSPVTGLAQDPRHRLALDPGKHEWSQAYGAVELTVL